MCHFSIAVGVDYQPVVSATVTFETGDSEQSQEKCLPVTLVEDDIAEGEEFFRVTIASVSPGSDTVSPGVLIVTPNVTNVIIMDNDSMFRDT